MDLARRAGSVQIREADATILAAGDTCRLHNLADVTILAQIRQQSVGGAARNAKIVRNFWIAAGPTRFCQQLTMRSPDLASYRLLGIPA